MGKWPFRRRPGPGLEADVDAEIREELELYLELRTRELTEQGMSLEDARRVDCARRRGGGGTVTGGG